MDKKTVYKLDSKGKTRVWTISVEGDKDSLTAPATIKIEAGLVDGKKVNESLEVTEGKNIGKANGTTPYSQAVSEAKAKLELKERAGYVKNVDEVSQGILRSGIPAPMLAQKYSPEGKQKGSKTLAKMKLEGKKIHVQPKLDGNRCLIKITPTDTGSTIAMFTRKGDLMPVQLTHISKEIALNYAENFWAESLPEDMPTLVLDGELFSTELSFNSLNGHLKRKDNQDLTELAKIKYHIYDILVDEPYADRHELIKTFASKHVEVIPSYEIVATDANIKEKLEEFLEEGNEGLMIRTLDKGYENKRSWQLVKVKLFQSFEAKLLSVELDKMGRLGAFIMEMEEPTKDATGKDITSFKAGTTGITHEQGMEIVKNKESYIGTSCTIEYFGVSEYGVPRFPKMKELNRIDI